MSAATVVTRHDVDGVAVLTYDVPGTRMNTLTEQGFVDLGRHLGEIAADDAVVGAVLISGKRGNFCAGADVMRLPELQALAAQGEAGAALEAARGVIEAMTDLGKPLVAAIHGVALGGGLELAMACHERLATEAAVTSFGLPEVKLGLQPGAGGTQLLPRLIGVPAALEHLLTGKTIYPRKAHALGLVDDLVPANQLERLAIARAAAIAAGERTVHGWAGTGVGRHGDDPLPSVGELDELLEGARALTEAETKGLWPAPPRIIDVVGTGLRDGLDAGLAAERKAFAELLLTPEADSGIHLFMASEAAKARHDARSAAQTRRIHVLGGGMMGAGLGAQAIDSGLAARVRDLSEEALAGVHRYADRVLRRKYEKRGAEFPYLYRERYHRLSTTTDLTGVGIADVVVEAVFESVEVKHAVIRETEPRMRADAIFATNTSAIPITTLAEASVRPERFIGMHFFSPVEKMPLVEIITHAGTSAETVRRTVALGLQLGKVPIVVADSPGFYTSRVFGRWLTEGMRLLLEGARIEQVDGAAAALGFPVGPMKAYDEVSLELAEKAAADPVVAAVTADRVDPGPVRTAVEALVDAGHLGRKAGLGFYTYVDDARQAPAEAVYGIIGATGDGALDDAAIRERLLWSFVSEALLCYEEGLLASAADGDVGAVFGIGFPPNLGGPFRYVDRLGAAEALARIEKLGAPAFTPADTLRTLAASGEGYGEANPPVSPHRPYRAST